MTYNFPNHQSGDTFLGVNFALLDGDNQPINIQGAKIEFAFVKARKLSTLTGEVEITNAAGGLFRVKSQIIAWQPRTYQYEMKITFSSGTVRTYLSGSWLIQ
jgi:hypothetical protein